jgi:hypothetical protein
MRALLITILLVSPAYAGNNEVTLGNSSRTLKSTSANALTEESLATGRLSYARDAGLSVAPKLRLLVEGALTFGGVQGTMFQEVTTEVTTVGFLVGARAEYVLHRYLTVGARVDLGPGYAGLTLTQDGHTASDSRWSGIVDAAVGVDALAVQSRRFSLGLRFELGYAIQHVPALAPTRDGGDDTAIKLEMMGASLGHLDLDGPSFGFSMISRF